jgi:hypothetical protein
VTVFLYYICPAPVSSPVTQIYIFFKKVTSPTKYVKCRQNEILKFYLQYFFDVLNIQKGKQVGTSLGPDIKVELFIRSLWDFNFMRTV